MAKKDPFSFNFGNNAKPKKKTGTGKKKTGGGRGNAWRAYVGVSNAPIPD
ncbi:MAG TPA: hypothetical protein VH643_21165 [Gemmataceae bacterium]|jgi:hypothetical protein